jgi:hypothetical protein
LPRPSISLAGAQAAESCRDDAGADRHCDHAPLQMANGDLLAGALEMSCFEQPRGVLKSYKTGFSLAARPTAREKGAPMSHLTFRSDFIRYIEKTRSVHLKADYARQELSVVITRRVIEYLADAANLDRDQSFTTVVRNKECLLVAAERAIERYGVTFYAVAVELADVQLSGLKAATVILRLGPEQLVVEKRAG